MIDPDTLNQRNSAQPPSLVTTTRTVHMNDEQIKPAPIFVILPPTIQAYSVSASNTKVHSASQYSHLYSCLSNLVMIYICL
jgi:hypothetical protein